MRFPSKQFRTRRYKTLTIGFALVFLLDVGLWIRGQFATDMWEFYPRFLTSEIACINRTNTIDLRPAFEGRYPQSWKLHHTSWEPFGLSWNMSTFSWGNILRVDFGRIPTSGEFIIHVGHRTIVILASALFLGFARLGWVKQIASGCCESCGYDLRATPERCPECGRAAERTP